MLNLYVLIKLGILSLIFCSYSLTQDKILQGLDNPDIRLRVNALYEIQKNKLQQYGPALEQRIFNQNELTIIDEYLITLSIINSQNLEAIALQMINIVDSFLVTDPPLDDPLETKVCATWVLIKIDNYSTIQYAFQILDRDFPRVSPAALEIIIATLYEVPEYFEDAKEELIRIINNCPNDNSRLFSLHALKKKLGVQAMDLIIDRFQNDEDYSIRSILLEYLVELNYSDLNNLLKNRLPVEPTPLLRLQIADTLLNKFGEPSDLKAVIDYQQNEPDESIKRTMEFFTHNFIPRIPDSSVTALQMAENVLEYTDTLYSYGWIPADSTYNSYKTELTAIRNALETDTSTVTMIENELTKIDADYHSNIITREAYPFLHFHLIYIKNRIE